MKLLVLLFTILLITNTSLFAQVKDNSVTVVNTFFGTQFYRNDRRLTTAELMRIMESNEKAHQQIKSARTKSVLANIVGGIGGILAGYPLGTAAGGSKANWTIAGIGAGIIVASIPLSLSAVKQTKKAVAIYNEGLKSESFLDRTELKIGFTGSGLGLMLHF